ASGPQVVINQPSGPIALDGGLGAPAAPAPRRAATKVFFVGASPFDISLDRLRADREYREIQRQERPDVLTAASRHAAGIDDLNAALVERPDILHLACHYADGTLRFEDPVGDPHPVSVAAFAQRLDAYRRHAGFTLAGLVLSACDSADFAERFTGLAGTVVAWRGLLDDECAIAFAGRLYRELGRDPGQSLGNAARLAAVEVATSDNACHNLGDQLLVVPA
ncbi:MAG: hypothetical protein HOV94_16395, partial [Saccharothrix sp.]|nr:hypothetical protein [Saccharothrix sp.]